MRPKATVPLLCAKVHKAKRSAGGVLAAASPQRPGNPCGRPATPRRVALPAAKRRAAELLTAGAMGSAGAQASYADTAKRLAGRSLLAVGSGLAAGSRLVAAGVSKGVAALTDNGDKEEVRSLKFAVLEWSVDSGSSEGGSGGSTTLQRLPVLLVGLATGFQVRHL